MKKVLSIAGSDCSGGAGIQADLKTFSAHGVFGMSVVVSVVAENTDRVIDIQDITPDCMNEVAAKLKYYSPQNVVVDPVMYAKNGCPLMQPAAIKTLIETIIPLADVLTPNIPEAERITGSKIQSITDMEDTAKRIYTMGCKAVIVKGGHVAGNALDVLYDGKEIYHFDTVRINTKGVSQ